jgi:hypothetical protein
MIHPSSLFARSLTVAVLYFEDHLYAFSHILRGVSHMQ